MPCGCGGGGARSAAKFSGAKQSVTVGPGVTGRMVFHTLDKQRIMLDPATPTKTFCIPTQDIETHPTFFIAGAACTR